MDFHSGFFGQFADVEGDLAEVVGGFLVDDCQVEGVRFRVGYQEGEPLFPHGVDGPHQDVGLLGGVADFQDCVRVGFCACSCLW